MPKIVTPTPDDIRNGTQRYIRWVQEISKAVNGGTEGGDVIETTAQNATDALNTVDGVVDGSTPIDPQIIDAGLLSSILAAQNENINAAAQSTGGAAMTAAANPSFAVHISQPSTTVTVTGGAGSPTIAWAYSSGDVGMNIDNATSFSPSWTSVIP